MKVKEAIEIMKAHNAWRTHQCDSDGIEGCGKVECKMPITTPSELTDAIDTLVKLAESLKITDDSPIVGRRYKQHAGGVIGEVKVIGIGGGHVIYRRKGFGAQLCACKDFLRHFDLIEKKK